MKKLILCTLLVAQTAAADYTAAIFKELGACVHATFNADSTAGTTALFIDEDTDTSNGTRTRNYGNGSSNRGNVQLCGLKEATKYYVTISAGNHGTLTCTEVCTDCDFGGGASPGFHCDAIGEPPNFVTDASFGAAPSPPLPPVHDFDPAEICEASPSTTRMLTCEGGIATDWNSKWSDARKQDSDLVHEILIPRGCVIQQSGRVTFGGWTGPGSGTGGIVIRSDGDSRLFPPPGVRTDFTYEPVLGGFRVPANRTMFGDSSAYNPFFFKFGAGDVCFQNVKFVMPEAEETNRVVRIVDVSGANNNILTTAEPLGSDIHDTDDVILDFDDCDGLQGAKNAFDADPNSSRIGVSGGPYSPTGPCKSGRAIFFTGAKIASIEASDPVRVHFTSEHAFYDLEDLTIESIVDNSDGTSTVNLAAPMHLTRGRWRYIREQDVVRVTGSGTPLDNQMLVVSSSTLTTIKVPSSGSCASGCGSIREHHTVVIVGSDLPELNGGHHYRKVDLDTIELIDRSVSRSGGAGGYALNDSDAHSGLIYLTPQERVAFDRVLGDCGRFPFRSALCIEVGRGDGVSIANSLFIGPKRSFAVDPISSQIRDSVEGSSNSTPRFVGYNRANDVQIRNTSVGDTHGIIFAGDNSCGSRMADITVQRVLAEKPNRHIAGHPDSNGMYYNDRHSLEFKCGERILLEGYHAGGSWADGTPAAPAVIFRALGGGGVLDPFPTRDIDIRGLHVTRAASGVQFLQGAVNNRAEPIQRVSITHSLFEELDIEQYASKPAQISSEKKANCCNFAGAWLLFAGDQSDILISNNTLGDQRCKGIGCLLDIGSGFQTRLLFADNVFPFSRNSSNLFGVSHENNGKNAYIPSCENLPNGQAVWECQVHQILANGQHIVDPSSAFRDNVIFGGLENMFISKELYDQRALSDSDSTTVTTMETEDYFFGWTTGNTYSPGSTLSARTEATFKPGSWEAQAPGKGFDRRQFMAYRGLIDDVELTDLGGGTARLSYQGAEAGDLTPEQCWVDYSRDPVFGQDWWNTGGRIADGGAAGLRTVDLTGLDPGKLYHWRLSCPGTQVRGQFRTEAFSPQ